MRYGEITIIRNLEEENVFKTMFRYFGYESIFNPNDTIILLLENDIIYDVTNEYSNTIYSFGSSNLTNNLFPMYFKKNDTKLGVYNKTAFYREPKTLNGIKQLAFGQIFKDYIKYNKDNVESSVYNVIYEDVNKNTMFSILKFKCNEDCPRFMLAYDETYFDNLELDCLINHIFRNKFD